MTTIPEILVNGRDGQMDSDHVVITVLAGANKRIVNKIVEALIMEQTFKSVEVRDVEP